MSELGRIPFLSSFSFSLLPLDWPAEASFEQGGRGVQAGEEPVLEAEKWYWKPTQKGTGSGAGAGKWDDED